MGLNVAAGADSGPKEQREISKKGPRAAIISGIIDLGIQEQEYMGEKQRDCREFTVILTLTADKYTDDEGEKHCMVTSPWPVKIKLGDKSNYKKFCIAADPNGEVVPDGVGDLSQLIGRGVFANMTHTVPTADGIIYANCSGISELPEDYPLGDAGFNSVVFDSENPDKEVWDKLWDRTKDAIRKGKGWDESKVGAIKTTPTPDEPTGQDAFDDDIPF